MKGVERAFKRTMIRAAGPLFPPRRIPPTQSILLVRVDDRLGNLVLLSPVIEWIQRVRPGAGIDLLASSTFASIYSDDPRIDRLLVIDKRMQKRFFVTFLADLRRVGAAAAGAAIDCSDRNAFSFSSALYTRASRAARRIGFANDLSASYLTDSISPAAAGHAAADPILLAAALFSIDPPAATPNLSLRLPEPTPDWSARLDSFERGAEGRVVGIHIGGRGAKRWPIPRFADLAAAFLDSGYRPWIFRGPMEAGDDSSMGGLVPRGLRIFPQSGVVEIAHAMRRCRLFVAPDTGPMHLASAVGTPTLAIFLSSDPDRYRPYGPSDRTIDARGSDLESGRVAAEALAMLGTNEEAAAR